MEQILKAKNEKWIKAQELEKNLTKNFIELGRILAELRTSEVHTEDEFKEKVDEYLKCGVTRAYTLIRIWEHRDSIDFEKYGMWKADEILKVKDEQDRKEFESTLEQKDSIEDIKEKRNEFMESKKWEKIDNKQKFDNVI
mgnify:CR=1 FL=1